MPQEMNIGELIIRNEALPWFNRRSGDFNRGSAEGLVVCCKSMVAVKPGLSTGLVVSRQSMVLESGVATKL